jgi:hypothetical protein
MPSTPPTGQYFFYISEDGGAQNLLSTSVYNIILTKGVNKTLAFNYDYQAGDDTYGPMDLIISTDSSGITPIAPGSVATPGLTVQTTSDPLTQTISGTVNGVSTGTYKFYLVGKIQNGALRTFGTRTIVVTIAGGSSLTLSPAPASTPGTEIKDASSNKPVVGTAFVSAQISILNGYGPYTITGYGLPNGFGLSSTPSGTPSTSITTSSAAFYIVGTPTIAGIVSNASLDVQDISSNPVVDFAGQYYKFDVQAGGGGSLTVTKVSQVPSTLQQGYATLITFSASGGTGSYTFSTSSAMPPGLTLTSSGTITGTPVEGADTSWPIRVNATDNTNTGYLDTTLVISSNSWIDGATSRFVDFFPNATIGTPYSETITARGGKIGSTYIIHFYTNTTGGNVASTGIPGVSVSGGAVVGNEIQVSASTLTVSGTPTGTPDPALLQAGLLNWNYYVTAQTTSGGTTNGTWVFVDTVQVSGTAGLGVSKSTFSNLKQGIASPNFTTISVTGGTGPYNWSTSSLPSGITKSSNSGASITLSYDGTGLYGTRTATMNVSDSSGTPLQGHLDISIPIDANILCTGTFPNSFTRGSAITPFSLVFSGGDNSAFTYVFTNKPNWMSILPNGSGNNTLTFSGTPDTSGSVSLAITVTVTTGTSTYSQPFTFTYTVSGSGISLRPYVTILDVKQTDQGDTHPRATVGALCTGGSSNTYTITPSGGSIDAGGPYSSGDMRLWTAPNNTQTSYTLTYTSVDSGAITATQTINVIAGTATIQQVSISPAQNVNMYVGQNIGFSATVPNSGCNSQGRWGIISSDIGCTTSPAYGTSTTVTAPGSITTPHTAVLVFTAFENPDVNVQYVGIFLLPGSSSSFAITTSTPLSVGTIGTSYNTQFTTSGGSAPVTYQLIAPDATPPPGLSFSSAGLLSGTPTGTNSLTYLAVVAKDNSTPNKYTAKLVSIQINTVAGGDPVILTVTPNSGLPGGGTAITVDGQNFQNGDTIRFYSPDAPSIYHDCTSNVFVNSTRITAVTPDWTSLMGGDPQPVTVAVVRTSVGYGYKTNGFQYTTGTAGFSISGCTPNTIITGGSTTNVTLAGTGFDSSCAVDYNPNVSAHMGYVGGLTVVSITPTAIVVTLPDTYFADATWIGNPKFKVSKSGSVSIEASNLLSISGTSLTITTTQTSFINGHQGNSYGPVDVTATGGIPPYSWSLANGILPINLVIANYPSGGIVYGRVSGTLASNATSQEFTIKVADNVGIIVSASFRIIVEGGTPSIQTTSMPDARIGVSYSKTLLPSGGTSPYTWEITSGSIPDGLTLNTSTGTISGTPTTSNSAPSTWNFTVKLTDSGVLFATKSLTLSLLPAITLVTISGISPVYGPLSGGTVVTITGTGFKTGCSVKFGTISALSVNVLNGTSVQATSPPKGSTGIVDITLNNPDGGSAVLHSAFEYRVIQSPIISSLDIQDGPFAGGQQVRIYGTNFSGITSINFGDSINGPAATIVTGSLNTSVTPNYIDILTPPGYSFGDGSVFKVENIFVTNASGTGSILDVNNRYTYRPPPIITAIIPNSGPTTGGQALYILGKNFFQRGNNKPRVFIGNVEVSSDNITLIES